MRTPADPRAAIFSRHRDAVVGKVTEALERGYSSTRIGQLLADDPGFVRKLFDGHTFRTSTLLLAIKRGSALERSPVDNGERQRKSRRGK